MADVALNLVFLAWKKLPVRVLILYPLFISSHLYSSQEVKIERFKVTKQTTSTTGMKLVTKLKTRANEQLQQQEPLSTTLKSKKREKDKVPNSSPLVAPPTEDTIQFLKNLTLTESNDFSTLVPMGSITMDTALSVWNPYSSQFEAKGHQEQQTQFQPVTHIEGQEFSPIQTMNLNIRRITLYEKPKQGGLWLTNRSIAPEEWNKLPALTVPKQAITTILFWNEQLKPFRNDGHESYPSSGCATLSQPLYGQTNSDNPVNYDKPTLQEFRLGTVIQKIHDKAGNITDPKLLYQELSTLIRQQKSMLQNLLVIDDMLGVHAERISVLLHSEGSDDTVTMTQTSTSSTGAILKHQKHQLLGIEYAYTPPKIMVDGVASAAQEPSQEIQWDIFEESKKLLLPQDWEEQEITRRKEKIKSRGIALPIVNLLAITNIPPQSKDDSIHVANIRSESPK